MTLLFCAGTVLGAALPAWADMEEDALRTREGLVRTLDVLKGRSDRTLIQAFRKEFPQFKAKTLEIRCLEDGGKLTSIIWTAKYRRRAATPVVVMYGRLPAKFLVFLSVPQPARAACFAS